MKINLKFLGGKTWQGGRPMSRLRGLWEGGNENISPGGQYQGRGGQPGRPPSHREPPPGPGWRWGRSHWRTGGRWRRRRLCWASPADQTPTSVRRNPDMASYICYLVIWTFLPRRSVHSRDWRPWRGGRKWWEDRACLPCWWSSAPASTGPGEAGEMSSFTCRDFILIFSIYLLRVVN